MLLSVARFRSVPCPQRGMAVEDVVEPSGDCSFFVEPAHWQRWRSILEFGLSARADKFTKFEQTIGLMEGMLSHGPAGKRTDDVARG